MRSFLPILVPLFCFPPPTSQGKGPLCISFSWVRATENPFLAPNRRGSPPLGTGLYHDLIPISPPVLVVVVKTLSTKGFTFPRLGGPFFCFGGSFFSGKLNGAGPITGRKSKIILFFFVSTIPSFLYFWHFGSTPFSQIDGVFLVCFFWGYREPFCSIRGGGASLVNGSLECFRFFSLFFW